MKQILLLNTGVGNNLGDRAMLLNVLRVASASCPTCQLVVSADVPGWLADEFGAQRCAQLHHIWGRWATFAKALRLPRVLNQLLEPLYRFFIVASCGVLSWLPAPLRARIPGMEGELIRSLADTHCVYFSGGGYLTDQGSSDARALLLTALLARSHGAHIVLTGQGLGPFRSPWSRWLLRRVLPAAKVLITREQAASFNCLRELDLVNKVRWRAGVDDACSMPIAPQPTAPPRPLLAINCRHSQFHENADAVEAVLLDVVRKHLDSGFDIRLFVFHERHSAELAAYERWLTQLPKTRVEIVQADDPRSVRSQLEICDRAVGVSYHFVLFALLAGLPVVALYRGTYYGDKFAGLASHFARENLALEQRDLSAREVAVRLDAQSKTCEKDTSRAGALRAECDAQIQAAMVLAVM